MKEDYILFPEDKEKMDKARRKHSVSASFSNELLCGDHKELKSKRDLIMRDITETLPADPDNDATICINYETLYGIVSSHLLGT